MANILQVCSCVGFSGQIRSGNTINTKTLSNSAGRRENICTGISPINNMLLSYAHSSVILFIKLDSMLNESFSAVTYLFRGVAFHKATIIKIGMLCDLKVQSVKVSKSWSSEETASHITCSYLFMYSHSCAPYLNDRLIVDNSSTQECFVHVTAFRFMSGLHLGKHGGNALPLTVC